MSPQSRDDVSSPDSSRPGGLVNVFRGLTTSRSSGSLPLSSSSSSVALPVAELVNATSTGLSPNNLGSYEQLKNGSLSERISAASSLRYTISEYPLKPVLDIWYAAKDLIEPNKPQAARAAGWELLTECVKHASSTDLERKEYFQTLAASANPEDFHLQLAALVDLTHSGRVLDGFDYELVPLLARWLREAYEAVRRARRAASSSSRTSRSANRSRAAASGEEKNFTQLFSFIIDVIKFGFKNADDVALGGLIDGLLNICMITSVEDDLRSCIAVLDTVVTFGSLPNDRLRSTIKVLSSIYCLVPGLQKDAWRTLGNLYKSHLGQATVRILLDVLRGLSPEPHKEKDNNMTREVKGALAVLQKLLSKGTEKGYPTVPYALLADGLSSTITATSTAKIHSMVLQLINSLFYDTDGQLHRLIVEEDWSAVLDVAAAAYKKHCEIYGPVRFLSSKDEQSHSSKDDRQEESVKRELLTLICRLQSIITQKTSEFVPRQSVINFFVAVYPLLPNIAASTFLDYFHDFRCCSPSDLEWKENLALVLDGFFNNRNRSSEVRLKALRIIVDAYDFFDLVGDGTDENPIPNLAKRVLQDAIEETDMVVLDAVMSLMVTVVASSDMELFNHIMSTLRDVVDNDRLRAPVTSTMSPPSMNPNNNAQVAEPSASNVVTKAYVKMFLSVMNSHGRKSVDLYKAIVYVAKSKHCEIDARLTAMKLLFRLRADWAQRVFVTKDLETNFVAAVICRTDASLAKKQEEESAQSLRTSRSEHGPVSRTSRGLSFGQAQVIDRGIPVRSASGPKAAGQYKQLWKLPDPGALPATVPSLISPILVSYSSGDGESSLEVSESKESRPSQCSLNMTIWLEAVLSILINNEDWEVYSFVLVHLPAQLSNHGIFRGALAQIQDLRKLICDRVRLNDFKEPPNASGLRRADVAICLFHSLTMILSYHDHFQKGEEDEIVRTFVIGISQWERTAQCCIHALSICCHELPLSASKSLGQMLNQMAAIITQPNVAIHILEFLACLSRLHNVYVNFREEEYRTVFAICFRYLEYARDKRQSNRNSIAGEPPTPSTTAGGDFTRPIASDELPQYVFSLAYQVILFWFLALKLPDRGKHVGPIVRKLFQDVDGSGQMGEEQALTTVDFMQRVTYADIDDSAEDPLFTDDRYGEIVTKRWLVGNCILTVKQSVGTGWAQVIKRTPSGTSAYMIRETLRPPALHQVPNNFDVSREGKPTANTVLPSHILLQLFSSIPQSMDASRPIPLPDDDDATERTLRVFDRFSVVDDHKAGVIYIGEGQTHEVEILANVSGSGDYVEFLNNLGTLTRLKGATFNTQGLDREYDIDGEYTFCWRDRLTEIVFHVTTQMPTNMERDPQIANKKRHIGNDYVNIIFNDSGLPFKYDTFPSQFNAVNIVITPASRASFIATREARLQQEEPQRQEDRGSPEQSFYRVQVLSKPGFPEISPASETKMVSLRALPGFIRLLALNASVFCQSWHNRAAGEHITPWRARLREIKRLREKHGPKVASMAPSMLLPHQQQMQPSPSPPPTTAGSHAAQQQQAPQQPPQLQQQSQLVQHQLQHQQQATATASSASTVSHQSGQTSQQQGQQQPQSQQLDSSRPSSSVRDSFTSLRRTSVATFFTSGSEQTSHRSSMFSGSGVTNDTEIGGAANTAPSAVDPLVDSVDFSKWA
jgi:hypothetical protein